jgi:low molecular weight protein-tyrosine phosphatase
MQTPKRVLFVCMGNICRSPAGEAVFRRYVQDHKLHDEIDIDSSGTIDYHVGEPPDSRMSEAAARRGFILNSKARQFKTYDFDRFDLIVAMDRENLKDIRALDITGEHRDKTHLLCDFLSNSNNPDVPDPYYGGPDGFDRVLDLIEQACQPMLDYLRSVPK